MWRMKGRPGLGIEIPKGKKCPVPGGLSGGSNWEVCVQDCLQQSRPCTAYSIFVRQQDTDAGPDRHRGQGPGEEGKEGAWGRGPGWPVERLPHSVHTAWLPCFTCLPKSTSLFPGRVISRGIYFAITNDNAFRFCFFLWLLIFRGDNGCVWEVV